MALKLEESHLYQEIHAQPEILAALLQKEQAAVTALAREIRRRNITYVVIAARGTSDNAARYANYLLSAHNTLPVALAAPSLFTLYNQPPKFGNALVLGISQSGKSPDIVAVLTEAHRQGALTAAITNVPDSPLARAADYVIDLHAGEECSVAATKTYTAQLAAIALLSVTLSGNAEEAAALAAVPDQIAAALKANSNLPQIAERYRYMRTCVTIGRGFNYATAFELALKLKELTYTMVEPYSSADFLHGPLALIDSGFPVIVFAPSGKLLTEMQDFMRKLKEREAELIVVSDHEETLGLGRITLQLPTGVPEWLSPLTAIIPGQQFAMHLAHTRDFDPDHPRALRKVTETR